jgi:hypothetical protein
VADFFGQRFRKNIWLTSHARESMVRRRIDAASLEFVIEQGEIKRRNNTHMLDLCRSIGTGGHYHQDRRDQLGAGG